MERLSTGLRDWLLSGGSMREAFKDCHIDVYSGSAPASADDQATGVKLLTITKANGAITSTLSLGERSKMDAWKIVLASAHAAADSCKIGITLNGGTKVTYTYLNTADAGDADAVRTEICKMLNDIPYLFAVEADAGDEEIYIGAKIPGDALVITDEGGTNITFTPTHCQTAARVDTIHFLPASAGSMSKHTEVWSGEVQVSGVAGYFRFVQPLDDGSAYSVSTPWIRGQGSIATSGAELGFTNTSLVDGDTHTVDTYSITLPAE